jgi:hypothetical protein
VVDGREIRTNVLLTPGGVQEHWWRREGHVLRLEDLRAVLDSHPERLIIGSGRTAACWAIPRAGHGN